MRTTAGVDLAAEPANTALAVIDWAASGALVVDVVVGADDVTVVSHCARAVKIGIDCPLGWPRAYLDFLVAQREGAPIPPTATVEQRRPLVYRETDRLCIERFGMRPLSVAADRIGHAALRGVGLLAALGERDRTGHGRVVEVYPAGSLRAWGLPYRGYKRRSGAPAREALVDALLTGAPWLDLGAHESVCRGSDDALDAVIAGLAARAAALGRATLPRREQCGVAREEGWIALPCCGLDELPEDPHGILDR